MTIMVNLKEGGYNSGETVISNIEFEVNAGELVGLIGANGAGKSTTIQAIMGTLPYTKGDMHIERFGYVPERPILYEYLTLWEHIDFLIRTTELTEEKYKIRAKKLLRLFGLHQKIHEYPVNFSKGMQQKVMLILAFLEEKPSYIIDEPFMGLDPQAMRRLLRIIHEERDRGAAILMSTHALDTAEKECDRFILVNNGVILFSGTLEEIRLHTKMPGASLLDAFDYLIEVHDDGTF